MLLVSVWLSVFECASVLLCARSCHCVGVRDSVVVLGGASRCCRVVVLGGASRCCRVRCCSGWCVSVLSCQVLFWVVRLGAVVSGAVLGGASRGCRVERLVVHGVRSSSVHQQCRVTSHHRVATNSELTGHGMHQCPTNSERGS